MCKADSRVRTIVVTYIFESLRHVKYQCSVICKFKQIGLGIDTYRAF